MSIEQALEFLGRVHQDDTLAAQVHEAFGKALVGLAAEQGFECSAGELAQALQELGHLGGELSDETLEMVAGGTLIESKIDILDPIDPDPDPGPWKPKKPKKPKKH
jgi:predicted ribosomally synthesized peptide with nif11-like leader